jgi:hypothetical protein
MVENHDKKMALRILGGVGLGYGIKKVVDSTKKTIPDQNMEPSFGNSSDKSANRCWQNSIFQTLRCSSTFTAYIKQRYPSQHILYTSFVSRLPYHASEMSQVMGDLLGPIKQKTEKMNVVGHLEDFLYQEYLKLFNMGYPFESEFKTRMNGANWFNLSGGAGSPVDLIYFLSVLFNDIISFDYTAPIMLPGMEMLGVYKNFANITTRKAIHFHYNLNETSIPKNTFSLVCIIKYSSLYNRESKTAVVLNTIPNLLYMTFLNPLFVLVPMLATVGIGSLHAFSMCRLQNSNDYYDNDTMYYYTNENVIKEQEINTYLMDKNEYYNTLLHPFKEFKNSIKQIEHPIIEYFVTNEPDTFNHTITINNSEFTKKISDGKLFNFNFTSSSEIYLLQSIVDANIRFVIQSSNVYSESTTQGVYVFVSNYDIVDNHDYFTVYVKP